MCSFDISNIFSFDEISNILWKSVSIKFKLVDTALLGRNLGDFGESVTDEEFLAESSQVRTDFPEAWIWDEKVTG